jgi:hypothetical protein
VVALDLGQGALASGMVGQDSEYPERVSLVQPAVEHSPQNAFTAQKHIHAAISKATLNGIASHWHLPLGEHSRLM